MSSSSCHQTKVLQKSTVKNGECYNSETTINKIAMCFFSVLHSFIFSLFLAYFSFLGQERVEGQTVFYVNESGIYCDIY